jgi:[ribulose-bisphosphate carboxylase]-lysine N-methyltransferase
MIFHSLVNTLAVTCLLPVASFQIGVQQNGPSRVSFSSRLHAETASFDTLVTSLDQALDACKSEITKTCKVTVGPSSSTGRLGLVATSNIKKGEVVLAMPYDERIELSASTARKVVFDGILASDYDGWTGDSGLITLLILNECARVSNQGIELPKRSEAMQTFMASWVSTLPSPQEMTSLHPLMWPEEDQEVLQSSSTNKVYQSLDDLEEDANWLVENIFSKDRTKFPETMTWNGAEIPCFSLDGYKWAMALAQSRSVFVDGSLRLLPIVDMCNHDDEGKEVTGASMGTFGTTKGAQLIASKNYASGEEVFCSYGPKSAADYLLEHGFCPPQCFKQAVSEVTLELDSEDRFYDDKMDILEFETYEQSPMDPKQSFDLVSAPGRDGDPDPAMIQFVRLCKLGGTDAFLLESIFRKETWGFMALPVSEKNELQVVDTICEVCEKALEDLKQCKEGGPEICTKLRESETKALTRTLEYLQREKEALDLKEYYQQRRLKDLGLDSDWSTEDDMGDGDPDLGFGQTRVPGGADYDW